MDDEWGLSLLKTHEMHKFINYYTLMSKWSRCAFGGRVTYSIKPKEKDAEDYNEGTMNGTNYDQHRRDVRRREGV